MDAVVTLAPWNAWPIAIPLAVLAVAVVASAAGTRRRLKPLREAGYVGVLVAGLLGTGMVWSLTGIWDGQQRADALRGLGYSSPTFGGSTDLSGGELPPIAFQAIRPDGMRVTGVLVQVDGDRWRVIEGRR